MRPRPAAALRDAFLSALVALGLFGAMIGLKTESGPSHLILLPRPWAVVWAVVAVFLGRLALLSWRAWRPAGTPSPRRLVALGGRAGRYVAPLLLAFALTLPFYAGRYWLDLGVLVLTYVMLNLPSYIALFDYAFGKNTANTAPTKDSRSRE